MKKERLYVLSLIVAILVMQEPVNGKKVIIHVPYRVKNVKHTHTIYKVIPHHHHHEKKDEYAAEEEESEEFDHFKK